MRVAMVESATVKSVVAAVPSVSVPVIINPAISAVNHDRMRTARGENDRGRKYRRGRQKEGQRKRIHHHTEPSRLRRRTGRTNANRYQTN
jgi:hypothetical protein